jgi:hypothetical protein
MEVAVALGVAARGCGGGRGAGAAWRWWLLDGGRAGVGEWGKSGEVGEGERAWRWWRRRLWG